MSGEAHKWIGLLGVLCIAAILSFVAVMLWRRHKHQHGYRYDRERERLRRAYWGFE